MRLTEKRESLYEAFEARRQQLVEARSRRAESLAGAADRIMQGIVSRSERLEDEDALRSYFVSDPMVDKVRNIAEQLGALGDSVRMDDVLSRLKTISDDSLRQLRDRKDLFVGGEGLITLGRHQFSVNRQPVELTSVVRGGELQIHLTGTQFFEPLRHEALEKSRDLWTQLLVSESEAIYRAEFLASELFHSWDDAQKQKYMKASEGEQQSLVRDAMQSRHDEGYSRGVHDRDASLILSTLYDCDERLGLLSYSPAIRGPARFLWQTQVPTEQRLQAERWIKAFATIESMLPQAQASQRYIERLEFLIGKRGKSVVEETQIRTVAEYLFCQLRTDGGFIASPQAVTAGSASS